MDIRGGVFTGALLTCGLAFALYAGPSSAQPISLATADTTVQGENAGDRAGDSVSSAGDVDGDGFDDVLIGIRHFGPETGPSSSSYPGRVVLVRGGAALPATIDLAAPPAGATVILDGAGGIEDLGKGVAGVGDINGDGFDDFAVTAPDTDFPGRSSAGAVYLIYGSPSLPGVIDLSTLGAAGVEIQGAAAGDHLGHTVNPAGDYDGDGFPDVVIGAEKANTLGRSDAGAVYVLFGGPALPGSIDLAAAGALAITISGASAGDHAGSGCMGIGDFDGDGNDDLVIGAEHADSGGSESGTAYIVYGGKSPIGDIDLGSLAASGGGVEIHGAHAGDHLGEGATAAGDVDGDGFADALIGAYEANRGGLSDVGEAYIIYGSGKAPAVLDAGALGGFGVTLRGIAAGDRLGHRLDAVGDFDGDGLDDVAIGSEGANPGGHNDAGAVYVVYGNAALPSLITGVDFHLYGQVYEGIDAGDRAGTSVRSAGDVNGDNGPDLIASAAHASPLGRSHAGEIYIVHGVALLAPTDLACSAVGTAISLSWSNPTAYDSIELYRDGTLIQTLAGTATAGTDDPAPTGTHTYSLVAHFGALDSSPVSCTLNIIVLPPVDLDCQSVEGTVSLTWTAGQTYSAIEIQRDGALLATLPGDATSFTDGPLAPGSAQYCVVGLSGSDASTATCCDIVVPQPPTTLNCSVDGHAVTLTWTSGEAYDSVVLRRDGVVIVTLPGGDTSYTDLGVTPGSHTYDVLGGIGSSLSVAASCDVYVVAEPTDLTCSAAGDTVTLGWLAADAYDFVHIARNGLDIATLPGGETSFVDAGLAPGIYTYAVTADIAGTLSESATCTVTVLIPMFGFECSAVAGEVFLSWTDGQLYDSIELFRDGTLVATLPGSATSYSDPGVAVGLHSYEIIAHAFGTQTAALVCEVEVLAAPFDFTCTAAASVITLTWVNGSAYDQLLLERDGVLLSVLPGGATSFTDFVSPGTYEYALVGTAGSSVSATATCEVVDPGAPSGLECSAAGDVATITWVNGALYDAVEVHLDGALWTTLPGAATSTSISPLGVGAHTVCVIGVLAGGTSNPACCSVTVPAEITDFGCSASGDVVTLSWTAGQLYETVEIVRDGVSLAVIPGFVQGYSDFGVAPGDHTYELIASVGGGVTLPVACSVHVLEALTGLTCDADGGTVTLAWTNGEIYDAITVHRNGFLIATLAGTASTFEDSGLSAGLYSYQLRAFLGGLSETALVECAATQPLAPFGLTCDLEGGDTVHLNWSNSQVGDAILVLRDGIEIATLPGTQSTFTDAGVAPGTYEYCLVNELNGGLSVATCCTVPVPAPPTDFTCVSTGTGVELAWTPGETYDSVLIYRNGLFLAAVPGSEASFTDPGIAPGAYTYSLRGFTAGSESASVDCTVTVPFAPADLTCDHSFTTVTLTWTLPMPYDAIEVRRNGEVVASLPGDATIYIDAGVSAGAYSYAVSGSVGSDISPAATCTVDVLEGPTDLTCCQADGAVELCWTSPGTFDAIEVFRGGILQATLPGDQTCYDDTLPGSGSFDYDVIGIVAGVETIPGFCSVSTLVAPTAVSCEVINGTQLLPDVEISWQLADTYDSIQLFADGTLLATVGGLTETFTAFDFDEGVHEFQVVAHRTVGECSSATSDPCSVEIVIPVFLRGDSNNDGEIDIADSVWILNYAFLDGPVPPCMDQADVNDDSVVDIADAIWMASYMFLFGPPPPPPFPTPGVDPTDDTLDCQNSFWMP